MIIVIAWAENERRHDGKPYAADLARRPTLIDVRVGHACMWLNAGTDADEIKARAYCERENAQPDTAPRRVFTYPNGERDPLGAARKDVLR